jgi:signal transduction histidine kinase
MPGKYSPEYWTGKNWSVEPDRDYINADFLATQTGNKVVIGRGMTDRDDDKGNPSSLRKQAEEILRNSVGTTEDVSALSCDELEKLVHELRVYQIELQIQNEGIGRTQDASGAVHDVVFHQSSFSDPKCRVQGFMAGILDIIARNKQVEEALLQAKAAVEEVNGAKSLFLANMSHELRTPLNAIIGFSEVLRDGSFGELNKKQTKYVDNVLVAGRRLLSLINILLDLAKVDAGKTDLERSEVDVKVLLDECLLFIREDTLRRGHTVDVIAPSELFIFADERVMRQVIFNLMSNATRFTPDGGKIAVKAETTNTDLKVSVRDSGIGIKAEDQERIFRAFEHVNNEASRRNKGTGLGLTLTKRFVELHGGKIWVESEGEGKGSEFTFTVPLDMSNGQALPQEKEMEAPLNQVPSSPALLRWDEATTSAAIMSEIAQEIDPLQALSLLRELKVLVGQNSTRADVLIDPIKAHLPGAAFEKRLRALQGSLEHYDFARAGNDLAELMAELEIPEPEM